MRKLRRPITALLVIIIIASFASISALADGNIAYGAATVSGPDLRIRTGPSKQNNIITHLCEGDIVVILERTNSEWYYINFHGVVGYVSVEFLKDILTAENFNAVGRVTGDSVNLRAKPNTTSDVLGIYAAEIEMTVIGINSGWYKVKYDNKTGYIRSDYMSIIGGYRSSDASNSPASSSISTTTTTPQVSAPPANLSLGQQIVSLALDYVGCRYVYGGSSPSGFDCSGFSSYIYKAFGYSITRNASGQYRDNGVHIAKSDLSYGDLVFFSSNGGKSVTHVGIYIGDNEFVHASTSSTGVIISRLDSTYYLNAWFGAKRIITQ